jgi:hypothetical protein
MCILFFLLFVKFVLTFQNFLCTLAADYHLDATLVANNFKVEVILIQSWFPAFHPISSYIISNVRYCVSISTGGAAMKAMINTEAAVNKQGIINTPNQPMYNLFSVETIHAAKRAHRLDTSFFSKIAVIIFFLLFLFLFPR